ncbi:MAG: stage II sporulation protein D [Ruminococcaceae bacterium]|nr:stage II sporulation protein D [Oscillospiraceae bacterium]
MKLKIIKFASFLIMLAFLLQNLSGCSEKRSVALPASIHPYEVPEQQNTDEEWQEGFDERKVLSVKIDGKVQNISLKHYLIGVLQGELPATFSLEAMKAQAVAARTVALKKVNAGVELCDDPNCCQAFVQMQPVAQHVIDAVEQTDGEVLVYGEELIEAVYFSCSGGMTEAAADVWGNEVAYLQPVVSLGEEEAPRFEQTVTIPRKMFLQTLQKAAPEIRADLQIGEPILTAGGGVKAIEIGGVVFTGVQLRSLFSLQSTNFEITENELSVRIHCLGFGHRVGMSQYGAQAMAEGGADYRKILSYYYNGTQIKKQS